MATMPRKESATDRVYEWVRTRILEGTFSAGRLLSEGEISEAVEVSRTPVREAFLRLASEGMLQLYPKRGALVVPVTASELNEVLTARSLIEPWAARALAGRGDRANVVTRLRALIAEAADALTVHDDQRFQEADRTFHQTIVSAAGNELLGGFYSSLRDRQVRAGMLAAQGAQGRAEEITEQHSAIADAIEKGDGEEASAELAEHLQRTARLLGLSFIP
jgi:DNA-binding GntR family transcriptional regulator